MIKAKTPKDENNIIISSEYGESIKIEFDEKIVFFLVFTGRNKIDQPKDFYIQTVQTFLKKVIVK